MYYKSSKKFFVLTLFTFAFSTLIFALHIPSLAGTPLHDTANMLSRSEQKELESYLFQIDRSTDVQIAVLTVPSLKNESLEDYAVRVFEKWQLGDGRKDTGVLLLISRDDRKIRIEVGYGLEGQLTDAKSGLIIRNIIAPEFKRGQYGRGIISGVKNIAGIVLGDETLISEEMMQEPDDNLSGVIYTVLILIIVLLHLFTGIRLPGFLWFLAGSGYGGRSSRGSGGGGFYGGGGSSGGGGASGGW